MMGTRRHFFLLLMLLALWPFASAFAQEGGVSASFRVMAVDGAGDWPQLYYYSEPEGLKAVRFFSGTRSMQMRYHGTNPLVFYRMGVDAQGDSVALPVGSVTLPAAGGPYLLLFQRGQPSAQGAVFTIHCIADDAAGFPAGSAAFLNLCATPLYGMFGDTPLLVAAGHIAGPFPVPVLDAQEKTGGVLIGFASRGNGSEVKKLFHSRWYLGGETRTLVIILPDADSPGAIRVVRLTQRIGALTH